MNATYIVCLIALSGPADSALRLAKIPHCQVLLLHDVQISASGAGPLVRVTAKAGDEVVQGKQLAQIDDVTARIEKAGAELERDAALARASDDIEVRFAEASLNLAIAELTQNLEVLKRSPGSISASEIRRLRLAKHRAELQVDRNKLDLRVAEMTADIHEGRVQAAEKRIQRRQILAPFGGIVYDVLRREHEWVDAGQPVMRIIRMDVLRVDAFINANEFNPEEIAGRPVTIEAQRARGRSVKLRGRVVHVSPIVHAGLRYRVQTEVKNRLEQGHWLLRPGMNAALTIDLQEKPAPLSTNLTPTSTPHSVTAAAETP